MGLKPCTRGGGGPSVLIMLPPPASQIRTASSARMANQWGTGTTWHVPANSRSYVCKCSSCCTTYVHAVLPACIANLLCAFSHPVASVLLAPQLTTGICMRCCNTQPDY